MKLSVKCYNRESNKTQLKEALKIMETAKNIFHEIIG